MYLILVLVFLPIFVSLLLFMSSNRAWQYSLISINILILSTISLFLFNANQVITLSFTPVIEYIFILFDLVLLLFFVHQGYHFKDTKVLLLALIQLLLYGIVEMTLTTPSGLTIIVDYLSLFMFLIINIVGGVITLYALQYMHYETMSAKRKTLFIVYLLLFLSIMNSIVMANSLLLFFFLFELTTLASYLLISFRGDELSRKNGLQALWMNQIGGVVILLGSLIASSHYNTIYFDTLLHQDAGLLLLITALFSMAAFVKSAAMPYDKWLLGAMVAPTPVSAMLHSATMVKIAPFMILKFAPILVGTLLGTMISTVGVLVFVFASFFALSRDVFKEILGYSTIALLGLMIAIAAIGGEQSLHIVMILIAFHALSKALLFLSAGVLEKTQHQKSIEEMKGLINYAPLSLFFILFGFITLVLPPFGFFVGKLFSIQLITQNLPQSNSMIILLLGVIIGSVLLTFLYFKLISALLSRKNDLQVTKKESMPWGFLVPLLLLSSLIVITSFVILIHFSEVSLFYVLAFVLLFIGIALLFHYLNKADRVKEYHCGEKEEFDSALQYYTLAPTHQKKVQWMFILLFLGIAVTGVIS